MPSFRHSYSTRRAAVEWEDRDYILLIDDDPGFGESLVTLLQGEGHRVIQCADGRLGLEYLLAKTIMPRLILLDFGMPEMDGWEFLEARKAYPRIAAIPVIGMSAMDEVHEDPETRDDVEFLLRKPLSIERLLDHVSRHAESDTAAG